MVAFKYIAIGACAAAGVAHAATAPDVSALVNTALAPEKVKFEEKIGKCTEKVPKDANAYHVCIIQQTFAGLQDLGKSGAFTLLAGISPALKADFDALLPAVQEAAAPCLKEKDVKKCIDGKLADLKKEYKDEEGKAALLDVLGKWHVDTSKCDKDKDVKELQKCAQDAVDNVFKNLGAIGAKIAAAAGLGR